jgi:hypothetical protein
MPARTRKGANLYADLTPVERARLLARFWRDENTPELDRLRLAIPNDRAGAAYNEALTALRNLNGDGIFNLLSSFRLGFERDVWVALSRLESARDRARLQTQIYRLNLLMPYPVTESEYRRLAQELRNLEDPVAKLGEVLLEEFMDEDADPAKLAHPGLRALAQEMVDLPDDDTFSDAAEDLMARAQKIVEAAIEAGELPKPEIREGKLSLLIGEIYDWAYGTSAETATPALGPSNYVPALGLLHLEVGDWDIRPDSEETAVRERREAIVSTVARMLEVDNLLTKEEAESLDPHIEWDLDAREREEERLQAFWPWRTPDRDREFTRTAGDQLTQRREEFLALVDEIEAVREEIFGGEDPLIPEISSRIEDASGWLNQALDLWGHVVDRIVEDAYATRLRQSLGVPIDEAAIDALHAEWPPIQRDHDTYDKLREAYARYLRT